MTEIAFKGVVDSATRDFAEILQAASVNPDLLVDEMTPEQMIDLAHAFDHIIQYARQAASKLRRCAK